MIPVWILTFNRPAALNRLIDRLFNQGFDDINILSNHPVLEIHNPAVVNHQIINTLNCEESNSWCARSWNTILMKAFARESRVICLQDDTDVADGFGDWVSEQATTFDFIWGPAGDQFFYLTLDVMRVVGFWDERYIGCYCADADFMKRCYFKWNKNRISIEEGHHWGFSHNPSGIAQHILIDRKAIDQNYVNQHTAFLLRGLNTITRSEIYYNKKWNGDIHQRIATINNSQQQVAEIDWYPWFSKKYDFDQALFGYG